MKIVFATNNENKIMEIKKLLEGKVQLLTLQDINCMEELPETGNTLKANALQKAKFVYQKYHINCFADDTGLEIEALNGRPGVFSARYAGKEKDATKNMDKVLDELKEISNRVAIFKTVIALIIDGKEYLFEGKVNGKITLYKHGDMGFGYDPIFIPDGYESTFANMSLEEKNKISHRSIAIRKLADFMNELDS